MWTLGEFEVYNLNFDCKFGTFTKVSSSKGFEFEPEISFSFTFKHYLDSLEVT